MLLIAALIVAALFVLLTGARVGGATRARWLPRWPAIVFAGAAILALVRGSISIAFGLAGLAVLAWFFYPALAKRPPAPAANPAPDPQDAEARALLGVGAHASASEIRTAYRERMRQAHPDHGGSHAQAARLTAARDRLVRRRGS